MGRTLYRQLLRWCQDTGSDIPLSSFVPPVTTTPSIVDQAALERLANGEDTFIRSLLPSNAILGEHQMTVPVRNAGELRNFFRAIYRMNVSPTDAQTQTERVNMAFETLRSLNELSEPLRSLLDERAKHLDRDGVAFSVGQVVQHKKDRWRGIILGWERVNLFTEDQLTSLTTKRYGPNEQETNEQPNGDRIRYTIVQDFGDAHFLAGPKKANQSGFPTYFETDLQLVQDVSLCRIRSRLVSKYFDRFNATSKSFVPNEALEYTYPMDRAYLDTSDKEQHATDERNKISDDITMAIQKIASRLERRVLDVTSSAESRGLEIIADFHHRLSQLSSGDVLTDQDRLTKICSPPLIATSHIQQFLNLSLELSELLWHRRMSQEAIGGIEFRLGDIVQHKKFGFRGVVVAWDPKPIVDVSNWDGLTHIEDANEKPFYHIVPDQGDCTKRFGGTRSIRYVCEENLERTPRHRTVLDVGLGLEWEKDDVEARYTAPQELRFKYGEQVDDDNTTEQCCMDLYQQISALNLAQRGIASIGDSEMQQLGEELSINVLFNFLRLANNIDSATAAEETIKELWKAHPDPAFRLRLDSGVADLLQGNREKARDTFQQLVLDDPTYGEAWNKASTCYFMLGDMQASLDAVNEAIDLIPRHFQAMGGLGMIQYETRRYKLAALSFRDCLQLNPWSPVSVRLSACQDLLYGSDLKEEQQFAAERTGPYE